MHDDMHMMLHAPGAEQIRVREQGWPSLPSGDSLKRSRLGKFVARVRRCVITTAAQPRRSLHGGEHPEPCQHGTKRPPQKRRAMIPAMRAAGVARMGWMRSGQKAHRGWNTHHCRGSSICKSWEALEGATWLESSLEPQAHAIVVAIGRIIIWGLVNAIPLRTLSRA